MQIRAHTRSQALAVGRGRSHMVHTLILTVSSRLADTSLLRTAAEVPENKKFLKIYLLPLFRASSVTDTKSWSRWCRSAVRTAREPNLATWQAWRLFKMAGICGIFLYRKQTR